MKKEARNIGLDIKAPAEACKDAHCPFHGSLSLRGRGFTGKIVSAKMSKTATVEWEARKYIPKYERYERSRKKVSAHNPECISVKEGDVVEIRECRPLSKSKSFCIVRVIK